MDPLIIEARVNEYATRNGNKNVPWLPNEIALDAAECFEAGASVVHFHGRDASGAPDNQFEAYRDTVAAIREASPILVHPSLGYLTTSPSLDERYANTAALARDQNTKPDFIPLDMGSVNADLYDIKKAAYRSLGTVYLNRTDVLLGLAQRLLADHIKPVLVAWNVSFLRQIEAFLKMSAIAPPLFVSLVLTDNILIAGHPGTVQGLEAYLGFLPRNTALAWAVTYIGGNLLALSDRIILAGGHIQIGLGDFPYIEDGCPTNADLVASVARRARQFGRRVASPGDVKRILRISKA